MCAPSPLIIAINALYADTPRLAGTKKSRRFVFLLHRTMSLFSSLCFSFVLAYTYDTRLTSLITQMFVPAPIPEATRPPCFYTCMPITIEKGKLGERSRVLLLPYRITQGPGMQPKASMSPRSPRMGGPILHLTINLST